MPVKFGLMALAAVASKRRRRGSYRDDSMPAVNPRISTAYEAPLSSIQQAQSGK